MAASKYDVIIVGAGAAGLMCAWLMGSCNKKVLLLDHSTKLAEKIRISGGGRCNFTNINASPDCYISQNPSFMVSALSRYTPYHFMQLLDKYNITYHEKTLGQLFCDNSAQDIIDLLDFLGREHKVTRLMNCKIKTIQSALDGYILETSLGAFIGERLIIATGGLSIPKIGASNFAYECAKQFGLSIIPPRPGLVPLTLNPEDLATFSTLSGISFMSKASITQLRNSISFVENTLITHRGLSGPAILQISSYLEPQQEIALDLLPNMSNLGNELRSYPKQNKSLTYFLQQYLSSRLATAICDLIQLDKLIANLSKNDIAKLEKTLHSFTLKPSGSEGYKKAEVTVGGVNTDDLSSKTMMAKNVSGLYFIGEAVDVTGWLGGYNFQWAWASAFAAAID